MAAVTVMEDDPAFNAGRGSKLTIMGHVEMDAAIMEGLGMRAGNTFIRQNRARNSESVDDFSFW